MKLVEYFFDIEKSDDVSSFSAKNYDFWSFDGQGTYYSFKCYEKFVDTDISGFMRRMCDFEFSFDAEYRVEWGNLQLLFSIEITDNSEAPELKPVKSNQCLMIRGFCAGECSERIIPYVGYATKILPSCEPIIKITRCGESLPINATLVVEGLKSSSAVKIGLIVTTRKNADYVDMLFDAAYWMRYCHCLDVVLLNLDDSTIDAESGVNFDHVYCAVHIKNNQMQLITNKQKIERLYNIYSVCPSADQFDKE